MSFKVGEPTHMPDIGHGGGLGSKYASLIERVKGMTNGTALPIEFDDQKSCASFGNGRSSWFRRQGIRMQRRGTVIYLSKLEPS